MEGAAACQWIVSIDRAATIETFAVTSRDAWAIFAGMDKPTPPPRIVVGTVCIELKGDQIRITPNKEHPGSPVCIPMARLEAWAKRIYRDEVLE